MGELIAVLSGKGGTGKTSVCAGIATALTELGAKVLCLDCDIGLRNLDISLGISQLGALSFMDVCSGGYSLNQAAAHPLYPNLHFLTAPMNCDAAQINLDDFHNMLTEARSYYHYIFLDAPAGIDAGFQLAARYADRILLVTGSDPAAVRDARRAGDILELIPHGGGIIGIPLDIYHHIFPAVGLQVLGHIFRIGKHLRLRHVGVVIIIAVPTHGGLEGSVFGHRSSFRKCNASPSNFRLSVR